MVVHPPTTSHRQLDEGQLAEAGIGPGLLRVSVGLEDVEDLERDFERALTSVRNRFASDTARATSGSAATAGVE
jgi:cystathionine beta-lyase/cystathionine gamma-synthase